MWHWVKKWRARDLRTQNADLGSRPCSRTDVGTDPDGAPQIHDLKSLCSCHGLNDKLKRGTEERGREGGSQSQNKGGCPLRVYVGAEGVKGHGSVLDRFC